MFIGRFHVNGVKGQVSPHPKRQERTEYDRRRNQTLERRERARLIAKEHRLKGKKLRLCKSCTNSAILGQTRCPTCAENHRQSRRRSDAKRRQRPRRCPPLKNRPHRRLSKGHGERTNGNSPRYIGNVISGKQPTSCSQAPDQTYTSEDRVPSPSVPATVMASTKKAAPPSGKYPEAPLTGRGNQKGTMYNPRYEDHQTP